jgi:hypothetical protein
MKDRKIKYDGKIINISDLPFTQEDKIAMYEDFKKGVALSVLRTKYKLGFWGIRFYLSELVKSKVTSKSPISIFTPKVYPKSNNILDELYPQYHWEELSLEELRFYAEYEEGRILRKSKLNNLEYEKSGRR